MHKYLSFVCLFVAAGCNSAPDKAIADRAAELSKTYVKHAEVVTAKQDQSIEILKANTDALTAIKSAVENLSQQSTTRADASQNEQIGDTLESISSTVKDLQGELLETRRAIGTMQAANDEPKPVPVAKSEPVIVPLIEPQVGKIVHAPAKKTTSTKATLRWNVNGNWNPTITETATHLRAEHGVSIDGMTEQQLHDLHADLHEGKSGGQPVGAIFPNPPASAITSQRTDFRPVTWGTNFVSRARYSTRQSCPSGRCPRR